MEETISKTQELLTLYGFNLLAALAIFVIGKWAVSLISQWFEKLLLRAKADETLAKFARDLCQTALLVFVVLAALARLGIQTASFIAVLGAAGFAVGMALQGSLSNFAAGVLILIFQPFKVGDVITAGGMTGQVHAIQIFNTILHTGDNVRIILPNSQTTGAAITNFSANPTRRIDLIIGVGYGDDLQKARKVLMDTITSDARVLKDPAPVVAVSDLAESSVNFAVRPWVKAADYGDTRFALIEKIKVELERNGLSIPFPQRDVHLIQMPAPAGVR